ncbi:hypothetical protein [Oceanobacillus massiliensis]|uniref:hypothetical protein n=1 Tax=Oceanobacillus massiliensis TaxID=1465765 RepID=UPI0030192CBE
MEKHKLMSRFLFYFGIVIMVLGAIQSYLNAQMMEYDNYGNETAMGFEMRYFLMSLIPYLFNGAVVIALSEIVKLLISLNLKPGEASASPGISSATEEETAEIQEINWSLSESDEEKIYELYSDKAILEIAPSRMQGYCIVTLHEFNGQLNSYKKVVDIAGTGAKEVHDPVIQKKALAMLEQ